MYILSMKGLKIGFVSTRFSGTDGVTLESYKWAGVFKELGHQCYWYAGLNENDPGFSMTVPEAFFNHPKNLELNKIIFGVNNRSRDITNQLNKYKEYLKDSLYDFISSFGIDLLIAENCLSIPMHIPLGMALTECISETGIPVIGHHHDLWWERPRFLINAVPEIIQQCFPPDLHSIHHVVINSMIQSDLASKRGLASTLIYNVVDFEKENHAITDFNRSFRKDFGFTAEDVLILQPTRVVARKGIEQAIQLVSRLERKNTHLLISHSSGDEGDEYLDWIMETAGNLGISVYLLHNRLNEDRKTNEQGEKLYSLWDVYPHVDLVTYPSVYEGFGNAFLEAVYFKKPILVNRYTVYIVDIEPKGFDIITMDGYLTNKTVDEVKNLLVNPERRSSMVEKNYQLARRFFSFRVLRKSLGYILDGFFGG
jgi:mannosylglucosylglycerate synthase